MRFAIACAAVVITSSAWAQTATAPEFEVASVKASKLGGLINVRTPTLNAEPGRDLHFENIQLRDLIMLAYGVSIRQISAPAWLYDPAGESNDTPRFDVIAKVPSDATKEQIPAMLRRLLEDRFKLQVHRENREMTIFALEGKPPLKLQESAPNDRREPSCARTMRMQPELMIIADCQRVTLADLAQQLGALAPSYFREGPVVDKSGIDGTYDFHLEWIRVEEANSGAGGDTIFASVQKFGLKLDKRKDTVETLVVDHCEKAPSEN